MVVDALKLIQSVSPFLSAFAIAVAAFVTTWSIYFQYKKEVAATQRSEEAFRAELPARTLDNLSDLLVQNFRTLNSFYSENLSQYRTSSIASISIAVLGFVVIISGLLLAFVGSQVAVGTVSSAAGIVGEASALLFFRQNRAFQTQMESSLKKLVSSQYLMTSIALAREMSGESKDQKISRINDHLRTLMDALHDLNLVRAA